MSLINDALKRASQYQQQETDTVRINLRPSSTLTSTLSPPASMPLSTPPSTRYTPSKPPSTAASTPQPGRSSALPVLATLLIATVVVFIWLAHHHGRGHAAQVAKAAAIPPPVRAVATPKPALPPATVKTVKVTAPTPVSASTSWRSLKVQAIFYSGAKSQAIVNGQTVYVGSTVRGFRVALISRNSVLFIAPDGSQKKVTLGE